MKSATLAGSRVVRRACGRLPREADLRYFVRRRTPLRGCLEQPLCPSRSRHPILAYSAITRPTIPLCPPRCTLRLRRVDTHRVPRLDIPPPPIQIQRMLSYPFPSTRHLHTPANAPHPSPPHVQGLRPPGMRPSIRPAFVLLPTSLLPQLPPSHSLVFLS